MLVFLNCLSELKVRRKEQTVSVADNIKKIRTMYDLTQKELGEIAGVTDKAVSTWESGTKDPRMGAIQKIADKFGLRVSDIIDGDIYNIEGNKISVSSIEREYIYKFRQLNEFGQQRTIAYIEGLLSSPEFIK